MAKVLISFVGTGSLEKGKSESDMKSAREYRKACYHLGEQDLGEFPFVAAALSSAHQVDKVILIGTVHSMWEEVYRYFSEKNGKRIDENVYLSIAEYCESANASSPLELPHKSEIEGAVGDARIEIIKYGVTEEKISENINKVLKLSEQFSSGDEVIVDITHSFRSLPILIMNLLIYMKNVGRKKINISHIYYGMLEISKEKGYAPIIDLKKVMELSDWITGAYSFSQYGNAYKVVELLEDTDASISSRLKKFSDELNLNHLDALEKEVCNLSAMKNNVYCSPLAEMVVKPVVDDFLRSFNVVKGKHSLFQFRIARWQFEHRNYGSALLSLQESILTYICEQEGMEWKDMNNRKKAKESLNLNMYPELQCYWQIKKMRNCVAHSLKTERNAESMIVKLRKSLNRLEKVIK